MQSISLMLALALMLLIGSAGPQPARAQPCPSSQCPAPGVTRGMPSYPCLPNQIKGDWNTGLYRLPGQPSYAASGYEINADTWCFDSEAQAGQHGFRPATR